MSSNNGVMSGRPHNHTVQKSISFRRVWNFRLNDYFTWDLTSSPFTLQDYGNEKWKMKLSKVSGFSNYCSLYLYRQEKPKEFSIDLTFTVSNRLSPENPFSKHYIGPLKKENGFLSFINFDSLKLMRSPFHDMVQIICEAELKPLSPVSTIPQVHVPQCDLSHDFGLLYNDKTTADVTLTITNKKYHAHRAILIARSSVFAAMFRNNMKETITNNVDIVDLDADIFEQVLRFIYTDKVSNLKDNAIDLLAAADRYDLQMLKAMCTKVLHQNINVKTAAELLVMADRHGASQLKTEAVNFITSHIKEVINTEGYRNLKKHHPDLVIELLEANTGAST